MSGFLEGKRALVTGASKGIGLAVAKALTLNGADIAICARNKADLEKSLDQLRGEAGGKVVGRVADVGKSADVANLSPTAIVAS